MNFLAPIFFLALGAIAVPVIIHLIQRERKDPLRFPSLANILQPVAQLPDLERSGVVAASGDDTIELTLPEARPIHPPPALQRSRTGGAAGRGAPAGGNRQRRASRA